MSSGWSKETLQTLRRFSGNRPGRSRPARSSGRARFGAGLADGVPGRMLSSPWQLSLLGIVAAGVFALVHLAVAAKGDISAFILVGRPQVQPHHLLSGIKVYPNGGYDGQFYYRLALDPLRWTRSAFGIVLDSPYRVARIAYPALVWLVSAGHHGLVPVALVVVNVVALGVLAACAGELARDMQRHPAWGLLVAGYWGFLWTIARDLTELVAAAALVAGMLAIRKAMPLTGALLLAVAVLARETALVFVAAVALTRAVAWVRSAMSVSRPWSGRTGGAISRGGPGRADLLWLVPVAAFVGWEVAVRQQIGVFPIRASAADNRGTPFVGMVDGLRHYVQALPSHASLPWVWEFALLGMVVLAAGAVFPSTHALLHERIAWIGYVILTVSLSKNIWFGDVGFRSLDEVYILSTVLLLASRRRLSPQAVAVGATWLAVFVQLSRVV
ncbi:MAG: hypothetical protein ACYDD4_00835 [Acidimicrobiales bacterium]